MMESAILLARGTITNAHRIRRGQMPDMRGADPSSDFHFVERDDPEKIVATLVKLVQERIPERFRLDPIRDVQVLCPMNRGSLGVRELNTALQKVLNPTRPGQPTVERFGWRFQIGGLWTPQYERTARKMGQYGRRLLLNGKPLTAILRKPGRQRQML